MNKKARRFKERLHIEKNYKGIKKSLKTKLMFSCIIIALISIALIASFTYVNNKNILTNKVGELSQKTSEQTELNIDGYLSQIQNATSLIFAHDNVLVFDPLNKTMDKYENEQTQKEINEYLLSISLMQNFTDFAFVYEDGSTIGKISETTKSSYDMANIYGELKEKVTSSKKTKRIGLLVRMQSTINYIIQNK